MTTLFILAFLLAIVISLGAGLYYLLTEREAKSRKLLHALSWRVGLQIALIIFLVIAYYFGWIHPHAVVPQQ